MTDPRTAYRESAARGASDVGQVVLLYEQMVEDLRRAGAALDDNRIDCRTNAINHTILILGQLQGRLNHEAGGQVAANLDRFYNVIRQNLIQAQVLQSKALLSNLIAALLEVRDAWHQADRAQRVVHAQPPEPAPVDATGPTTNRACVDWEG